MRRWAFLIAIALAGCAGGEYQQISGIKGGGRGLPVVSMRANSDEVVPPGRGAPIGLAVRAFVPGTEEEWTEVAGARCHVTGGNFFSADLVTPARLVLPDLGPDAPALRADCASGAATGTDIVGPVYSWPADRPVPPLNRFVWGGGWWYGLQKSGPMRYPDLAVGMRYQAPG
jgi:hypothetical protein